MIVYSKAFWQLPLALHFGRGSPLTRNLLLPVLSCVETVLLYLFTCKHVVEPLGSAEGEDGEDGLNVAQCAVKWFFHPFPYQLYTSFIAFILVFRVNMSIARFWEGRTFMETARIRWADACMQLVLFDEAANRSGGAYSSSSVLWRAHVLHLFSLMHACACQYLRDDMDLNNLQPAGPMVTAPASQTAAGEPAAGSPRRVSPRRVSPRRVSLDGSSAEGDVWVDALRDSGEEMARPPGSVRIVLSQSPGPHAENGGEAFLRSNPLFNAFRLRTGAHAHAAFNCAVQLPVLGGVSEQERAALAATHARVRLVQTWILRAMADRLADEGLSIGTRHPPTPIVTRIYQLMSEATHAFAQARKLVETPFPLPHAHLVSLSLLVFAFTTPVMVVAWTANLWVAILMNAISVFSFVACNEVACDLEDPFIGPPNQISLATMHQHLNEDMMSYGHEYAMIARQSHARNKVTELPASAVRAAKAAQAAQGGGGGTGLAVEWAGSPYTVLRCFLVPLRAECKPAVAAPPEPYGADATLNPLADEGVFCGPIRRSLSASVLPPRPVANGAATSRAASPTVALHETLFVA